MRIFNDNRYLVRMRSKLNGATDWTNFIHCPVTGMLLGEYTLISGTYTVKSVNTWGMGLISTNREGTKRYFHFDGVGSTFALTSDNGTVTDNYSYSAFGVLESSTVTSINPFRYVGQFGYYDDGAMGSNSGLFLLGVRYYSPSWGRFISWDPLRSDKWLYAYVRQSPHMGIDPSGLRGLFESLWETFFPPSPFDGSYIPPPWQQSELDPVRLPPGFGGLLRLSSVRDTNLLGWGFGNCCGWDRRCGKGMSNGTCLDLACENHDTCVGSGFFEGVRNWIPCSHSFCLDLLRCYRDNNCDSQMTASPECQAIFEAASLFCAIGGFH